MKANRKISKQPISKERQLSNTTYNGFLIPLCVFLFSFLLYSNTLHHNYVFDDNSVIVKNTIVNKGLASIPDFFTTSYREGYHHLDDGLYRPIPLCFFALAWELAPNNPSIGHWINVVSFALLGLLIFVSLKKWFPEKRLVGLLTTLLFVAHPIHTEVVANIKSLDEILGLGFCLLTLLQLTTPINASGLKRTIHNVLVGVCFLCALLSKESTFTLILIAPLFLRFHFQLNWKETIVKCIPLFVATTIAIALRYNALDGQLTFEENTIMDNFLLSAIDTESRIATACYCQAKYLGLLCAPYALCYDYSYNQIPVLNPTDWSAIFAAILLVSVLAMTAFFRSGAKYMALGILWYLISISLSSNVLFLTGVGFAERLVFMPSLGFCFAFSVFIVFLSDKISIRFPSVKSNYFAFSVFFPLLLFFSIATSQRNKVWQNNLTLFQADIAKQSNNTKAFCFLGSELLQRARTAGNSTENNNSDEMDGVAALKRSIAIYPYNADALTALGSHYLQTNNLDSAVALLEKAIIYSPRNIFAMNNLVSGYQKQGEVSLAIKTAQNAIAIDETDPMLWINLGSLYGMSNQFDSALKCFSQALSLEPNNPDAMKLKIITLQKMNNTIKVVTP